MFSYLWVGIHHCPMPSIDNDAGLLRNIDVWTIDLPQPDETWKNKLSPNQYYVLRMVSVFD